MKFLANIRMNDRHGHNKKFLAAHLDWLLEGFPFGVDIGVPEFRDWMFNIMQEIVDKFDVDGLGRTDIRYCDFGLLQARFG